MPKTAHGTLTANTVSTVNVTPGDEGLVIVNRSLEGELWVRIDGRDPAIGGSDSYVVIGAREFPMTRRMVQTVGGLNVKLISDADRAFSVEAIQ